MSLSRSKPQRNPLSASLVALAASLLLGTPAAQAEVTVFPLNNPGFEEPELNPQGTFFPGVQGWQWTGPLGTTYKLPFLPQPSEGDQMVFANFDNFNLFQEIGPLQPDTTYTLSMDIHPLVPLAQTTIQMVIEDSQNFSAFYAQGNYQPVWNPGLRDFNLQEFTWNTITISFDSNNWTQNHGLQTRIRLMANYMLIDNVQLLVDAPRGPRDFYISATDGNDANDGLTPASPYASFSAINGEELVPGDRVFLKRGDVWNDELQLSGEGDPGNEIILTSYGDPSADRPRIERSDILKDRCITIEGASDWYISDLECSTAKIGLYLRYDNDFFNSNVTVENCHFEDMPDPVADPSLNNYEYAWSTGLFIGGKIDNQNANFPVLDGFTVRDVSGTNLAMTVGNGWYYPLPNRSRLRNVYMDSVTGVGNMNGAFAFYSVDGGYFTNIRSVVGGGDTPFGTALSFLQNCQNVVIDDSEFAFCDRFESGDGVGVDFEGDNENVVLSNSVVHNNDGSAVLILSTMGTNKNLRLENNVFYNNALDPWNSEINSEIINGDDFNWGQVINNGFYRSCPTVDFISDTDNWTYFWFNQNRFAEYSDVANLPKWFDGIEGWERFGTNVAISPDTFVNTFERPYIWMRMSQTAASGASIVYATETDPAFDGPKTVPFPVSNDGLVHDYFINLESPSLKGVITNAALIMDDIDSANIEFVRFVESPTLYSEPEEYVQTVKLVTRPDSRWDGWLAQDGSFDENSNSLIVGDNANNEAYRSILHFEGLDEIPRHVEIVNATLGITRTAESSNFFDSPFFTHGELVYDMSSKWFGQKKLSSSDWDETADVQEAGKFLNAFRDGLTVYSRLRPDAVAILRDHPMAQFRLRFTTDNDGDNVQDTVEFGSTENTGVAPTLVIEYIP